MKVISESDVPELLNNSWHRLAGVEKPIKKPFPTLEQLEKSQWSDEFEHKMRNRLLMGAFRYGILGDPEKPKYDNIPSIKRRVDTYVETGNTEHLIDAANICLVEFVEGEHSNKHFRAVDDGIHTSVKK